MDALLVETAMLKEEIFFEQYVQPIRKFQLYRIFLLLMFTEHVSETKEENFTVPYFDIHAIFHKLIIVPFYS